MLKNPKNETYRSQFKIILDKQQAESSYARKALHSIKLGFVKDPYNLIVVSDTQELFDKGNPSRIFLLVHSMCAYCMKRRGDSL